MSAKITKKSLGRFSKESGKILRILTGGNKDELEFQEFCEIVKQFNLERSNYLNFVVESLNVISILTRILWFLYFKAIFIVSIHLFGRGDLFKLVIYPLIIVLIRASFNTINSFLFLIRMHPYDIGDRLLISEFNIEEDLIVRSIGLASTTFKRWNNEIVIFNNKILQRKVIKNLIRFKKHSWSLKGFEQTNEIAPTN